MKPALKVLCKSTLLSAVQAGPAAADFAAMGVAAEKLLAGGQVAVIEATRTLGGHRLGAAGHKGHAKDRHQDNRR